MNILPLHCLHVWPVPPPLPKEPLAEQFGVETGLEELEIEPEDDIAPGSLQPVVYLTPEGERRMAQMRWGFKLPDRLLFNARSEGVATSRFWRQAFEQRRCIVPADSFFEWFHDNPGKKTKFEITVHEGALFGMAGLWSPWQNPKTRQWEQTFSILTGEPNEVMSPIRDRQPAILEPRDYAEYLAPAPRPLVHLLRILPSEEMHATVFMPQEPEKRQGSLF